MKKLLLHISLFFSLIGFSQNEQLAQYYYDKGDFEKAKISYEELLQSVPQNYQYFIRTIDCYQQLKQFEVAEKAIQTRLDKYKQSSLLVELGYNFKIQQQDEKAQKYFEQALAKIKSNPNEVYGIANSFEKKVLLDYALQAYKTAVQLQPNFNFNYQMGLLYGQLGNTDMMISTFLDEAFVHQESTILIQNQFSRFMTDEGDAGFSANLRKALITRTQKNQDVYWNQFLSWFYTQQKEFGKAFVQEKAIYKRNPESLNAIINLAQLAIDEKDDTTATTILEFVLENTTEIELLVQANTYLMQVKIDTTSEKDWPNLETELSALISKYGISPFTLSLQLMQAHFLTFNLKKPEAGKTIVRAALELQLDEYETAKAKMELADILLYEEKFNQALLYYSQIEEDLKNDVLGHEASLKAAKTSYFKADFDWALTQLKVLKSASTQLIANDALELFLLVNDNTVADSTRTALKKFSKGDFYLYQNKNQEALTQFQQILKDHKGEEIEDETILRIGQTYQELTDYNNALLFYQQIIDNHPESIYRDEALFFSAEIYNKHLNQPEKAKPLYEAVLFNHQDSIHFVEARKNFRQLRGDSNL